MTRTMPNGHRNTYMIYLSCLAALKAATAVFDNFAGCAGTTNLICTLFVRSAAHHACSRHIPGEALGKANKTTVWPRYAFRYLRSHV
ncbi:hypothetical protein LZ30DRAFT_373438 [Colletotrichum cereale]|nr:hypothetical protein LZ30DRAFT_373438 [Colletotrichum cereale]